MQDADIRERLASFGALPDDKLPIAEAALWLAKLDLPRANIGSYLHHIKVVADDIAAAARGIKHLRERVAALREVIYRHHGYAGDGKSYDDQQNANLMRVIDRKKGLPVALGILVIHGARRQGWAITGLNFPGHFLLRMQMEGEIALLDPFSGLRRIGADQLKPLLQRVQGREVQLRPEFIRSVSDREVLLRLQNNIKSRALAQGDAQRAVDVVESMVLIAPGNVSLGDELAALRARLRGKLH